MSKRAKQLMLASAVPILILLGMSVLPLYTLLNGEEMILKTRPFDPSDPFRGDYVNLNYEAEQVPKELVDPAVVKKVENGSGNVTVYVLFEKRNGVHSPVRVTLNKPKSGPYLKGSLDYISENANQEKVAFIQYNLDKYFVEDNSGTKWEQLSAKGELLAKAKIFNGYAYLTEITKK